MARRGSGGGGGRGGGRRSIDRIPTSTRTQRETLKRLLGYIAVSWMLRVVFVLIVITTVFDILSPAIIGSIIDMVRALSTGEIVAFKRGVGGFPSSILLPIASWYSAASGSNPSFGALLVFSLSLIVIAIITGLFTFLQRYTTTIVAQEATYKIREDMYNSLLKQSFSFYDQQRTGQLMARATGDINMMGRFYQMGVRMVLSSVLLLVLVLYALISINPTLTLLSLSVVPFVFLSTAYFSRNVRPLWNLFREQYGVITSVLQENLAGTRVVRGFSREEFEEKKFSVELMEYFDLNMDLAWFRARFGPLASFISSLGFVLIIWYGGGQVISGIITVGSVVAFYFYLAKLMGPVRRIGFMTSMVVRAIAAGNRVFDIIDAEVEVHDRKDAVDVQEIEGCITFKDVWFSYDGTNMVLKNINLTVQPGQTIAILGATGSGKSSIINLIPRFYNASKGSIHLDGVDLQDFKIKSLRSNMGVVRQEPFIFSTTLRENIAYGVKNASIISIRKAAKRAKINDFIESLPDGYETRVGERGVTLSGGQKQRIAIARALLKNPKILIMDDSTSSVDTHTEYEIQQAIDELLEDRTTFIITQRLSSIRKADYIIVLDDGEIAEEGTHDELLEIDGIYRKLYETQSSGAQRRRT
jgi:ATP-binding cassette subfamily B protein|tara:strand:- start:1981 stop:3906 length:1926 start_codon:yes stop_codon:yes gene_type:complete